MSKHGPDRYLNTVKKVATNLYISLDTPVSLSCYMLLKYEEYDQLVDKGVNPDWYNDYTAFAYDYQATSFLRKCPGLPTTFDRGESSLQAFAEAEDRCKNFNLRMVSKDDPGHSRRSVLIYNMARKISSILGPLPAVEDLNCRFGPGATSSSSGRNVNILHKLQSSIECSRDALPLVLRSLKADPHWEAAVRGLDIEGPVCYVEPLTFTNVTHNSLQFVPKDAKKDRAICVEPSGHVPLQLGFGAYIKQRLLFAGIDLSKQPDVNRHYAKVGSIDGTYATIDLSGASDSISWSLVAEVLPAPWFDALASLTCEYTLLPNGTLHKNEKFSSMGNGFTFELETLIFLSLLLCTRDMEDESGYVGCFGDDLIVPTQLALPVMDNLTLCGFKVNTEKSFWSGRFRESCGFDFFDGHNVRPYFFKKDKSCDSIEIVGILNGIRLFANRVCPLRGFCDSRLKKAWVQTLDLLPRHLRLFGPDYLGDSVILSPRRSGLSSTVGWVLRVKVFEARKDSFSLSKTASYSSITKVAAILRHQPDRVSIRSSKLSYRIVSRSIPAWCWYSYDWI